MRKTFITLFALLTACFLIQTIQCSTVRAQTNDTKLLTSNKPTTAEELSVGINNLENQVPLNSNAMQQTSDLQNDINYVKTSLSKIEDMVLTLRKQVTPPSANQFDEIQSKIDGLNNVINELSAKTRSSVGQMQEQELRDRIFELNLSVELLRRRAGLSNAVTPFGMSFFTQSISQSTSQPVALPANYVLRSNDKLLILAISSLGAQTEYHEKIAPDGMINIAGIGKLKASGLTITSLSRLINQRIKSRFKQMRFELTLEGMSSISVQVAGSVVRPGTYTLDGASTLMTALYKAGGPTDTGSFRKIIISRTGQQKKYSDLYEFFLNANKNQDHALRDGDLIFVSPVGKTIIIDGEVNRPARYEPSFPITLAGALKLAGGTKPGSYLQQVKVERIENGEYRVLLSAPVKDGAALKFQVLPGDEISIASVRPERTNAVAITGPVNSPGTYGYKPGMRVSDLITLAQGISQSKEIFTGRADILRIDPMKGTELLSFDLAKALAGNESDNLELKKLDQVFLYIPNQVEFRNNRIRVSGAVVIPGVYERKDGMRISDVIAAAGGVLPEAYLKRAELLRTKENGTQELHTVSLQQALSRAASDDMVLKDSDEVVVYTNAQVAWKDSTVRIEGAVQRPGVYKRPDKMHLSDLLFAAGGTLPEADSIAELSRLSFTGKAAITKIDVAKITPGSESDIELADRDIITIASMNPSLREPEIIYITGEVRNPGPYALGPKAEKLTDIISRAGGLTQRADVNGLIFMRNHKSLGNEQQLKDVDSIIKKILSLANKQFLTQLAQLGIKLPDQFVQEVRMSTDEVARPLKSTQVMSEDGTVIDTDEAISGQSQKDMTGSKSVFEKNITPPANGGVTQVEQARERGKIVGQELIIGHESEPTALGSKVADLPNDIPAGLEANRKASELLESSRISVDFSKALDDTKSSDNLVVRDGDRIHVPTITDTVTVLGAVLHPHSFAAGKDRHVDYYIERSGGFSEDAVRKATVVVHSNGDAVLASTVKNVAPGDIIVVPNTGLIDIARRWEKMGSVTKVISDILSSVYVLTRF